MVMDLVAGYREFDFEEVHDDSSVGISNACEAWVFLKTKLDHEI